MLTCKKHTAFIYDRGGLHQIGRLTNLTRVKWSRVRDDISLATVYVSSPSLKCAELLGRIEAGRHELVIFRGARRVWEGPIMRQGLQRSTAEIEAHDVMRYVNRTILHNEYDDRYPNNGLVLDRIDRAMTAEMARKEALDPPVNVLTHVQYIKATPPATDAGTAARSLPFEETLFEMSDEYAARGGVDYTVVGRSILFFDVHTKIGQTAQVSEDDFLGEPIATQYGSELATRVAMTDGKGNYGVWPPMTEPIDPYYGEWEVLHHAYGESAGPVNPLEPEEGPTVEEMTSQARRSYDQGKVPPWVVRVPDNTSLNPNGVLSIDDLVPGVHIPLVIQVPGRTINQMQKLDKMTVEETPKGETVKVVMSPASLESSYVEEPE